ncbi:MAG TPA: NADH-quinone oxidoreductase subunit H [Marmoricola sp.]|nr:NADH-quinone oxidoreductase subunit H [Marmoricola sp.]
MGEASGPAGASFWWGPGVVATGLFVLALGAACLDAVLASRGRGLPLGRRAAAPLHEAAHLLRQQRRSTVQADALLWRVTGPGLLVVAVLMVAVVPWGHRVVADLDVGVVWFNAMDVTVWALVWLAGWGPNSAYALVGGYRFLALGLGYELPLMFALTAPAVGAGSLRLLDIAQAQQGLWFVVWMPVAFLVFCVGVLGFSVSGPFSAPVGADLSGGVLAETSGVDRLLLQVGRYALLAAGAAFAVPTFLGGGAGPLLPQWLWCVVKTCVLLAGLVAVRRRLPALRPERFAEAGWIVLLPATLLQVLVVAVVVVVRS